MWRLRRENERGWNDGFHINTRAEAEGLCELLNKLEREVAEAKEQRDKDHAKIENQAERIKYLEGATNHATGTPLSKMREQRDRLAEALDRLERTAGLAALQDDPARVKARQALAAVKGGSDE
jgi:septal ring factor EnvC (AmiA/AmiB activator)